MSAEWTEGVAGVQCDECERTTICKQFGVGQEEDGDSEWLCRPCYVGDDLDNASDPPSAFCAEHSRVCACGTSTVGTYVNGGRHRADVCGWGEAALTRWAPSQTSASVDAVPDAPLSTDSAHCPAVPSDLATSGPDRAADVASTTTHPPEAG